MIFISRGSVNSRSMVRHPPTASKFSRRSSTWATRIKSPRRASPCQMGRYIIRTVFWSGRKREKRNLQLLSPVDVVRWQFNFYSKLLSENLFIELISYFSFASFLAHAFYALLITIQNRRSNGKRYEYYRRSVSSRWYSRKIGLLGTIIFVFLIIHFKRFLVPFTVWSCSSRQRWTKRAVYARR